MNANTCPECDSSAIEGGYVDVDGLTASQECGCGACEAEWILTFCLSDVTVTRPGLNQYRDQEPTK